jgi:transcription antitermination factor NusG
VYTRPRWEKKVTNLLIRAGIEVYCPLNKVRKKWKDRVKLVEEPLIRSYVFVHISEAEKTSVRMVDGIVNFVYWLGKPAVIRQEEIELIQRFLGDYENVEVRPLELLEGQRVRVVSGVLMNKEGLVVKVLNNRASVVVLSLGVELVAQFEKQSLEVVNS